MAKTIANVLKGIAELGIRQPNDALAEWWATTPHTGTYSAKLKKTGSGNAGSTHIEVIPPTSVTLGTFNTNMGIAGKWKFFYNHQLGVTGNFTQVDFRFEDPNSDGHIEITAVPFQNHDGLGIWTEYDFEASSPKCGYYGANEVGTRMDDWSLATATTATVRGIIGQLTVGGAEDSADDWICKRVRYELWESSPERFALIDSVVIDGTAYTIEPGGTAPGLSLSAPYTEVGYTEDGVTFEYTVDETDTEVDEETFAIGREITKETIAVTCNLVESSLANINNAMAGSVLSENILTFGGGVNKKMSIRIKGTAPGGFGREIFLPLVTATGAVGMTFKRAEKVIIPVTFQALKPATGPVCTWVNNIV